MHLPALCAFYDKKVRAWTAHYGSSRARTDWLTHPLVHSYTLVVHPRVPAVTRDAAMKARHWLLGTLKKKLSTTSCLMCHDLPTHMKTGKDNIV